jgi:DNA-binding transcriptional MerR regulator/methylmalonyl-CoA mutase cobalamin-binding subunit
LDIGAPEQMLSPMARAADLPVRKVAEATGIDPATLRAWERRYGCPTPRRTPSGQRRYSPADVAHLRLVAAARRTGRGPAELLTAAPHELRALANGPSASGASAASAAEPAGRWLAAALALDADALRAEVRAAAAERELVALLDDLIAPFLRALGGAWADGRAEVEHEHLAAAVLAAELARLGDARNRDGAAAGPRLALATLPGERHALGLAMVAALCAERGLPQAHLGADLPCERIARAAVVLDADVVALSVSLAHAGVATERAVRELRALLPDPVELWLGGSGVQGRRRRPRGVRTFASLRAFLDALPAAPPEGATS